MHIIFCKKLSMIIIFFQHFWHLSQFFPVLSSFFLFCPDKTGRNRFLPLFSGCPGRNRFLPEETQPWYMLIHYWPKTAELEITYTNQSCVMEVTKAKSIYRFYNASKPFSALTTITGRIITVREIINMFYMAHCLAASAWWSMAPMLQYIHIQKHMMTSSNGTIFRVTGPLCGEFTGEFPAQRPVTRTFDVFFDLRLNKRLSKQLWGWWFETPSRSLWRHCNEEQDYLLSPAPTQRYLSLQFNNSLVAERCGSHSKNVICNLIKQNSSLGTRN